MTARIPDYTEIYQGDRYCLMCSHACPVERVLKREATSPHGWALLIASERRGLVKWDAETVDTLYQCADCGLCQANCVSNRPLPAAIVMARADVVEREVAPAAVRAVAQSLRQWGHPYGEQFHDPFASATDNGSATGLFIGAATTYHRPHAVEAASKLLNAAGVEHTLLSTGRSGAYLPYTLGLWDEARTLAAQTIEEIGKRGVKQIITLSREDVHTFRNVYKEIDVAFPEDVRIVEFIEWLASALDANDIKASRLDLMGYVYHDPAHTPRVTGAAEVSRRVLARLTGMPVGELLWRDRLAAPAGSVGGFEFTQPALAEKLSRYRLEQAKRAGAVGIVTEDPQCAAQLAMYAEGLPVINLVETLAENVSRI